MTENVVETAENQNICRTLSHSVFDCDDKENCQLWKVRDLGKWYFLLLFRRAASTILIRKYMYVGLDAKSRILFEDSSFTYLYALDPL